MYSELERIDEEVVMTYFKVLLQHLPGRAEENHKKFHPRLNKVLSEYKSDSCKC
jgi:hypothetical protein